MHIVLLVASTQVFPLAVSQHFKELMHSESLLQRLIRDPLNKPVIGGQMPGLESVKIDYHGLLYDLQKRFKKLINLR